MNDDQIGDLLSELAGVDTQDTDLRHHPDAYAAVETALAPLLQDLAAHEASNRIKTENLETLRADNAKLREALEGCLSVIERADTSEGVCCCGDDMERHGNPMDSGHSPVDAGHYHSTRIVEAARAALGKSDE